MSTSREHHGSSPKQRRKPLSNERGEPICFNCSAYGHVSLNCPAPQRRVRCNACGRVSHEEKDCKEKSESGTRVAQNVVDFDFRVAEVANEKYFTVAKANSCDIRAYVDLGSQCITLREEDADRIGITYAKLSKPFTIGGYGSGHVTLCGEANITLTVDQATANVPTLVTLVLDIGTNIGASA